MAHINPKRYQQRGAAVIVALFVMALAAAAAVAMMARLHIDIRRTELLLNSTQADLYAQGSVLWAIEKLNNNWQQKKPNQVVDKTPILSKVETQQGYTISSSIEDMQAYFNLNNLLTPEGQISFMRLLQYADSRLDANATKAIMFAVVDWISPAPTNPEYESFYAKQTPPYRAGHRFMTSVSELRLARGITPELFERLAPYITALPEPTKISVNNAPAPVLMSLSNTLTLPTAQAIASYCQQSPFVSDQRFLQFEIVKNNFIQDNRITTLSNYFLVKTHVSVGQQETVLYTLLMRTTKDTQAITTVVWQTKGTL